MDYEHDYMEDSEADDDYDRTINVPTDYDTSPTDSNPPSNEVTPTTYTHSGASHPSPRGLITQWTPDQCADYVAGLGMEYEQYADAIVEDDIDGEALVAIRHEELKDMGVASLGHRLTILKGVYDVKVKQNLSIEPEHYVPLSADANAPDAHASQDDIARVMHQMRLSEERLRVAESELRSMKEDLNRVWEESRRLREDTLPVIAMAKNKLPPLPGEALPDQLPSPHGTVHTVELKAPEGLSKSLSRKISTKVFRGGSSNSKIPSPTIHEGSSLDPSTVATASSHLTHSLNASASASVLYSQQPSPTSPPYNLTSSRFPRTEAPLLPNRYPTAEDAPWPYSTTSTVLSDPRDRDRDRDRTAPAAAPPPPPYSRAVTAPAGPTLLSTVNPTLSSTTLPSTAAAPPSTADKDPSDRPQESLPTSSDFMKSFRVSMEEPCHKVLPVALKKYHINEDWRQYSLYIVHGDQERCLGLDERPLILFKQLATEGKKPMFMLRKHAAPTEGFARGRDGVGSMGGSSSGGGVEGGVPMGRVQSYAGSAPLRGGQL